MPSCGPSTQHSVAGSLRLQVYGTSDPCRVHRRLRCHYWHQASSSLTSHRRVRCDTTYELATNILLAYHSPTRADALAHLSIRVGTRQAKRKIRSDLSPRFQRRCKILLQRRMNIGTKRSDFLTVTLSTVILSLCAYDLVESV